MNALDLIMLGRQLTKIGEEVLRGSKAQAMPTGPSLVLRDVFAHPGSSITDVTARTGLPQSYVSESVARLRDQGIVETSADPADGRRTLVRVTAAHPRTVAAKGSAPVDAALAAALGERPTRSRSSIPSARWPSASAPITRPHPAGARPGPPGALMHTGALMAARQALGQYLVYARRWQRALIAGG